MAEEKQASGGDNHDWYEKGRRLSHKGRHREAVEALTLAITEYPLHAEAYFVRGACQYALGNYREAGDDLDAAALLGCRDAQFWSKYEITVPDKDAVDDAD
jgi:tetratricopeptide (TPR) repeat protein